MKELKIKFDNKDELTEFFTALSVHNISSDNQKRNGLVNRIRRQILQQI